MTATPPPYPSFWQAFWYWLKLGCISFGGPAGQIALMHQELVERRRWISEKRFLHALNYCMVLPGPEAQQLSIYMGWLLHRTWGGIAAGTLFVLPSLLILMVLTYVYLRFGDWWWIQALFNGIKPAVVAIVLFAAWRIGARTLKNPLLWGIAVVSFLALTVFNLPFPLIVLGAGLGGWLASKLKPDWVQLAHAHATHTNHLGKAVISDDTPATPFSWKRFTLTTLIFLAIGIIALALLPAGTLHTMGVFFTKAALVTFGGAYAVLPYVNQAAVEQYHWLTSHQMLDGLALGETTPGPLIMVVAFVGFVGGWTQQLFGADALLWAGGAGAIVATFFTFLPSFYFILAGAPIIEATQNDLRFTAPLTAITAAVVGVIVNLAVVLGWQVFLPLASQQQPWRGGIDYGALVIAVVAFVALWRFKRSIIEVIAVSAVVGLGYAALLR